MKKLILVLGLCVGLSASADILYWMVDTASSDTFAYNAIRLVDDNTGASVESFTGLSTGAIASFQADGSFFDSTIDGYLGSFFVELLNDSSVVASSSKMSLTDLAANIFKGGINPGIGSPASFGGFTSAVPEPTSGMLFLIGGMLLGLKRRRTV